MTHQLDLNIAELDGRTVPATFTIDEVLLAGYTGRDRATVMEHIHELETLGVAPPPRIPMVFAVDPDLLTTHPHIDVNEQQTSGEAEFYLIQSDDGLLVGVGSDHTDRKHEAIDVAASKGMCPKVLSAWVWRYADVRDHWDRLQLRAWVTNADGRRLYQSGQLGEFLSVDALLAELRSAGHADLHHRIVFGGTLRVIGGFAYSHIFEAELRDDVLDRRLDCGYEIRLTSLKGRSAT
jgi:hypothetical protein